LGSFEVALLDERRHRRRECVVVEREREREREREKGGSWYFGLGRCERFWVAGNCVEMEVTGSCRLVSRQCNVPVSARESNGIQQQQQQKQQVCNLGGSAFMGERVVHAFLKTGQCTSLKGKAQSRIRPKKQSLVVSSVLADFPMETVVAPREQKVKKLANPNTVFSIILGGGAGKRLNPLTLQRATPAVSSTASGSLKISSSVGKNPLWSRVVKRCPK
jgi:hypothetical protein